MKKEALLLIILFSITIVSASYNCSTGDLETDNNDIDIGKKRTINGIGIGIIDADEIPAFSRIVANILINSKNLEITNSSTTFEIREEEYTASLTNLSDENAKIRIDSSTEDIEIGEVKSIGGLEVFLFSAQGTYPETATANILTGTEKIELSNDQNPSEIKTIDNSDYLFEIISASDENAVIGVGKCDNGTITEIIEEIQNTTETNSTSETNSTEIQQNQTSETTTEENQTTKNSEETSPENQIPAQQESKISFIEDYFNYIIIGIIVIIAFIIIFLIISIKNRAKEEKSVRQIRSQM